MSFGELVRRTWRENVLFSVTLELTYRCNLDCSFCYNDLALRGEPLTTAEYLRLFDDLRDMQVLNLVLTGGEPLAHPDFFTLGGRARELGFAVRVKSNGHALRGRLARRLKEEVDPFVVDVSLHGARPETHDRQTRVPGSFERLLENLREMRDLGVRLKLNCTLTRWNEAEVEGIFAVADDLGLPLAINPTVSPRDDGDRGPLALSPSREGKLHLFRVLARRAGARPERAAAPAELGRQADEAVPAISLEKSCGAGSSGLTVDPFGSVLPCVQWRRSLGNLRESSIRDIWNGSARLAEVRATALAAGRTVAAQGSAGPRLAFCMGLAEHATGDPTAVYPSAREQMELLGEVAADSRPRRSPLPVLP